MIKENTVFILGAGASAPYGYPTGQKLRYQICFKFLIPFIEYLQTLFQFEEDRELWWKRLANKFRDVFFKSSTKSIDLFLSRNTRFLEIGKIAIIYMILHAEAQSKYREEMSDNSQDWYSFLFDRMTDDFIRGDQYHIAENKTSYITFNYDRSFEHFLFESLNSSFSVIDEKEIIAELNKIKIIHLYGQVARLYWQDPRASLSYKYNLNELNIFRLADNIRVIYDKRDDPLIKESQELIKSAKRIFFLGFGYAKENLEVLNLPEILEKQFVYGTALDYTNKEIVDVKNIFIQHYVKKYGTSVVPPLYFFENTDCVGLLKKYL